MKMAYPHNNFWYEESDNFKFDKVSFFKFWKKQSLIEICDDEDMGRSMKKSMDVRNIGTKGIFEVFNLINNIEEHLFMLADDWFFEYFDSYIKIFSPFFC